MKEQLRTEAEKRNLVYAKNINNEYNITGLIDISKNPPKIYCFCTEEIAKEILDFHAQQSKERDDQHAIAFAEWMHENTVYSGNGFYTSFIPKHNNCQFKLIQLIKLYNQSL